MKKYYLLSLFVILLLASCKTKKEEAIMDNSINQMVDNDDLITEENTLNNEEETENIENKDDVDIDLTEVSATIAYAEVYNMVSEPNAYVGKRIKIRGIFQYAEDIETNEKYYGCTIMDATACCYLGLMFIPSEEDNIPEEYAIINVTGTFETYQDDNGYTLCRLKDVIIEE